MQHSRFNELYRRWAVSSWGWQTVNNSRNANRRRKIYDVHIKVNEIILHFYSWDDKIVRTVKAGVKWQIWKLFYGKSTKRFSYLEVINLVDSRLGSKMDFSLSWLCHYRNFFFESLTVTIGINLRSVFLQGFAYFLNNS